jgi:hypothetical protein
MANPMPARRPGWTVWTAGVAVAASVLFAAILIQRSPAPATEKSEFVAIPYVAPPAPYEQVRVMRMTVPVAALVAAGFRVQGLEPAATVSADVLVGQDGRAHSVRLISQGSLLQ